MLCRSVLPVWTASQTWTRPFQLERDVRRDAPLEVRPPTLAQLGGSAKGFQRGESPLTLFHRPPCGVSKSVSRHAVKGDHYIWIALASTEE